MELQNDINKEINLECNRLKELLIKKNEICDNSFFRNLDEYGNVLMCIRIEDKLNMLKQIVLQGANNGKPNEELNDALIELANYTILSKIYLKRLGRKT